MWRLLKEGTAQFDVQLARNILARKCAATNVAPVQANFLTSSTIEEARLYWDSDLVPLIAGDPPLFDDVVAELWDLLAAFLG